MLALVFEAGFLVSAKVCSVKELVLSRITSWSMPVSEISYPIDHLVQTLWCKRLRSAFKANWGNNHPPGQCQRRAQHDGLHWQGGRSKGR